MPASMLRPRPARDRLLETFAREAVDVDPQLAGISVEIRFDGGVAHVTGTAPDQAALDRLREVIGRLAGVHAIWDRVRLPGQSPLITVDVGAGGGKQYPENLALDLYPLPGVDVVADLRAGLPLRDDSVDRIFAVHVLEHLLDLLPVLAELHRVLAPHGVLHVMAPDWQAGTAVADPTHVRFFSVQTFKYFCSPKPGVPPWRPLHASHDGETVFADLMPVKGDVEMLPKERLAQFFD